MSVLVFVLLGTFFLFLLVIGAVVLLVESVWNLFGGGKIKSDDQDIRDRYPELDERLKRLEEKGEEK